MKNHVKHKLILMVLLVVISFSFFSANTNTKTVTAADQTVKPYATPTSDPIIFLGIWLTNGYSLQPESDYYTQVNNSIVIHTSASRSVWTFLQGMGIINGDAPHYRWYKSTNYGQNWTEVSSADGGHRMNFPVTPKTAGTTWYQMDTQYYRLLSPLLKTHIYSKVTAVHAKDPVNATSLKVTADNNYIYNESDNDLAQNYTFIHAYPTPADSTGPITYSVDKPEIADFATDSENGGTTNQLLAKSGATGMVTVTATMQNPDGSTAKGSTTVKVGGGLDDQTVMVGNPATFTIHGSVDGTNDNSLGSINIQWFKYDKSGKKTTVASSSSTNYKDFVSYTIPKTTMDDDGTQYQAQITVSLLGGLIQTDSLTTNKAILNVKNKPNISITDKAINKTYDDGSNTDTTLNNVTKKDNINYSFTLNNTNDNSEVDNGFYVIPLHSGTTINSVTLDGNVLDSSKYTIITDGNNDDLTISGLNFDNNTKSHSISIDTTTPNITSKESFESQSYIYGNSYGGTTYMTNADPIEINYVNDEFNVSVNDIDFGSINPFDKDQIKYRPDKYNLPNNVINIDDQRRNKTAMKIFVSEPSQLADGLSLRYYEGQNYTDLSSSETLITQTTDNSVSPSIGWTKNNGLLLYKDDTILPSGKYTTKLNWNFEDSI